MIHSPISHDYAPSDNNSKKRRYNKSYGDISSAVTHDTTKHTFSHPSGGYLLYENDTSNSMTIRLTHTYVPYRSRGQGIAKLLCDAAFQYAKCTNFRVIPECTYIVHTYLRRFPCKEAYDTGNYINFIFHHLCV